MNWKDQSLSSAERARLLVAEMTLEEKVSQMTYFSSALPRFGIPEYNWWNEALHGVARAGSATVLPQAIGMAASFNAPLLHDAASMIAQETRIKHKAAAAWEDRGIYKGLTMWSPNINIFRDPRWGRGHETYGEDPFLTACMGVSFIKGLQGDDPDHPLCDATAKHFAAHSGPEATRHHFDARPTPKDMSLTYLPAFEAAVKEGHVHAVMGAYNRVNGEASCASKTLLQRTLRDTLGFDGYVVSDCGAIEDIYEHHNLCKDPAEAAALAVHNGCDLCCGRVFPHLLEAVKRGLVSEEDVTRSAERLLAARIRLGLLDEGHPTITPEEYLQNDCAAHHALSLQVARETLTLLKNDGILPLKEKELKTLTVIGPNADSRLALLGNYAGTPSETWTVLEGLQKLLPETRILYAQGCSITGGSPEESWGETSAYRLAEALQAASIADAVVVVTGLNGELESEESAESAGSGDRLTLDLPESQRELLDALHTLHKPMVLVNMTGSAVVFPHEEDFGAIVQAWYPGQMGGIAVAEMLLGRFAPSGRLPLTFYRSTDQLPAFDDYHMAGRTYRYFKGDCAYPFGFGLSYNTYRYDSLCAEKTSEGVTLTVDVTNEGTLPGLEPVQAYVRWLNPESEMPQLQFAALEKVTLVPGETKRVVLCIPESALRVCLDDGAFAAHHGGWEFLVGGQQPDARSTALSGRMPLAVTVKE